MAKKKKFINKVVFLQNPKFHDRPGKSPYIYIQDIEDDGGPGVHLIGIDRLGNRRKVFIYKGRVYKEMEIMDMIGEQQHMSYDFIKAVFEWK